MKEKAKKLVVVVCKAARHAGTGAKKGHGTVGTWVGV